MEELLSEMRDARQDLLSRKEERRPAALEREAEKEGLDAAIRRHTNKRTHSPSEETLEENSTLATSSSFQKTPRSKKLCIQMDPFKDDILIFTETLAKGDEAQSAIQEKRIMLHQRRLEYEMEQKARDREDRKRERDEDRKLDLERHRMLFASFHEKKRH